MFRLTKKQQEKFEAWQKTLDPPMDAYTGAIGGRFTWCYTPTSLGTVLKVKDGMSEAVVDLSDYEDW